MRPWAIVIIIFLLIFALAIMAGAGLIWMIGQPPKVASNSILEVSIEGEMPEAPSDNPFVQIFEPDQMSLYDYWMTFDYAARDSRVGGVYLEVGPLGLSWAQIEELRDAIARFKESNKPVRAFLSVDVVGEKELYLASAADTIGLNPDAALLVNGLAAEVTFYKRTLEKLGVAPQFLQFKEFKSAEVYEREQLSDPVREMLLSIITDLEARFAAKVAQDRKVDPSVIEDLVRVGMSTPEMAKEANLIDTIGYRGEILEALREETNASKYTGIGASDYFKSADQRFAVSSPNRVALVTGTGVITAGGVDAFDGGIDGSELANHLRQIRKDSQYKAVLLRVDSPGGSAVGSDMVWNEVQELEKAGKPVVVSMSGVAGSGGYYISMGAGKIVSQPSTITGSIGVIFGKFDIKGLADWLGMNIDRVKVSPNADMFSPFTSLNEEQKAQMRTWMQLVYDTFVNKAAEGRGMTYEELEPKAHGRIYTGAQAMEIGLVDELGGYDASVALLKTALQLDEKEQIQLDRYPKPKTFWETLASGKLVSLRAQPKLAEWLRQQLEELQTVAPRVLMPDVDFR